MSQNWRMTGESGVIAADYFNQRKRKDEIDQRRPVIRKAGDLVGPGIGVAAVRITDYNNLLATFNGYYSSDVGALNAPNATEAFVGDVVSDSVLGGRQVFTGLTSGIEYTRTFVRSPVDPEFIGWGVWRGARIPATANGPSGVNTSVFTGSNTILAPPTLSTIGESGVYEVTDAGILIRKQGVYTGHIQVGWVGSGTASVYLSLPSGSTTSTVFHATQSLTPTVYYPFTVWANDGNQGFGVNVLQSSGSSVLAFWRFQCTRVGDAV